MSGYFCVLSKQISRHVHTLSFIKTCTLSRPSKVQCTLGKEGPSSRICFSSELNLPFEVNTFETKLKIWLRDCSPILQQRCDHCFYLTLQTNTGLAVTDNRQ